MKSKTVFQLAATLAIAAVSFSTSSVRAASTESTDAVAINLAPKPPGEFTWLEFGQSVAWGANHWGSRRGSGRPHWRTRRRRGRLCRRILGRGGDRRIELPQRRD